MLEITRYHQTGDELDEKERKDLEGAALHPALGRR